MKIIITRPRADAEILAQKLVAIGHEVVIAPVLDIVPRTNVVVPNVQYQAVCLTSANGVRCFGGALDLNLPVFAVGEQSAAAARKFGFRNINAKGGDVHGLVQNIIENLKPDAGSLLYISGSETSGDLDGQLRRAGFTVDRIITYDAVEQNLASLRAEISSADAVVLYSPRSAKLWQKQMTAMNLNDKMVQMRHFCLSPAVATILSSNSHIEIANSPSEDAMLTMLERRIGDKA